MTQSATGIVVTPTSLAATGIVVTPTSLVLDIEGGNLTAGTAVIVWTQNTPPSPNQLWTLTSDGHIWNANTYKLSIVSGNRQIQPRVQPVGVGGTPFAMFTELSVAFKDYYGNPLVGKHITWIVENIINAMAVTPGMAVTLGTSLTTSTTDANGIATLNQLNGYSAYAYNADGWFNIVANSDYVWTTFSETVGTPSSVLSTTIVAGNNQVWGRADGGSASFFPLKVKVVDANGTPAAGVEVGFRIGSAPDGMIVGFITSSGRSFAISTTDANGIATLDGMVAHGNTGPFTVLVYTVGGSMNPAIFNETVSS